MNHLTNLSLTLFATLSLSTVSATTIDNVINEGANRAKDNATAQHQIDKVVDVTEQRYEEYRQLSLSLTNLTSYNDLLQKQIDDQGTRIEKLNLSLKNAAQMHRDILPLIDEMVASLEQLIRLDLPFLMQERSTRIAQLKHLINNSNVDIAEKYRQVVEAYQIEMEFSRTIESYRDKLVIDGEERELNLLRLGRIALLYRSDDGEHLGAWNKATKQWQTIEASQFDRSIKHGIAMALKKKAPALITLPIITNTNPS